VRSLTFKWSASARAVTIAAPAQPLDYLE